jgi:hypothetical protein
MRNSEFNANRSLHETATANKRIAAMHAVGKRQQKRASSARNFVRDCMSPGTGLGLLARAVGLLLAFGSFIAATVPGGAT